MIASNPFNLTSPRLEGNVNVSTAEYHAPYSRTSATRVVTFERFPANSFLFFFFLCLNSFFLGRISNSLIRWCFFFLEGIQLRASWTFRYSQVTKSDHVSCYDFLIDHFVCILLLYNKAFCRVNKNFLKFSLLFSFPLLFFVHNFLFIDDDRFLSLF